MLHKSSFPPPGEASLGILESKLANLVGKFIINSQLTPNQIGQWDYNCRLEYRMEDECLVLVVIQHNAIIHILCEVSRLLNTKIFKSSYMF